MSIVLFEDAQTERLAPVTLARLAASITCGSLRLVDLTDQLSSHVFSLARPHLHSLQRTDFPTLQPLDFESADTSETYAKLLLNARVAPTKTNYDRLRTLYQRASTGAPPAVVMDRGFVAAVVNPPWSMATMAKDHQQGAMESLAAQVAGFEIIELPIATLAAPHEIIATNMACIRENLQWRIERSESGTMSEGSNSSEGTFSAIRQLQDGVFVGHGAKLGEYVLTDTSKGPIIIDRGATVGPYTLLRGPIYIGPKARILEHAAIKDAVSLSHTTKIGGEVEASVVEPYTNKQHHGFLGHSYLGSWINLGAGTCNSDLKNTYGTVNMEYSFGKGTTGMQFLGCIMGDYSKTAINTGIFTGKVIGVCSMMYGFVTSNVPSFVNYARLFGQIASLPPEVMVSTQQRMFARRDVKQRGCDVQLIYDMHRLTQSERDRASDLITA